MERCDTEEQAFQSTLPARGATARNRRTQHEYHISIHAPRTGSDRTRTRRSSATQISIHAPRTGSDGRKRPRKGKEEKFQSTLPARGATSAFWYWSTATFYFNPRSPHGERRPTSLRITLSERFQSTLPARGATEKPPAGRTSRRNFNPRSPHGERRHQRPHQPPEDGDFNPRSPHGERPAASSACHSDKEISIHAPRTGSDGLGRRKERK